MSYRDEACGLKVHFETQHYALASEEIAKMEGNLHCLQKLADDFPVSDLHVDIIRHPRSHDFHVKTTLRLPKHRIFTGDRHAMLHPAYERCLRKLVHKVKAYKERLRHVPERKHAQDGTAHELWPTCPPDVEALERAASTGDYAQFRQAIHVYDDGLHQRLSHWVERYPEIVSRLGRDLALEDLVEEVYLLAFEGFPSRPSDRLGNWLEGLMDPAVRAIRVPAEA